ncbi:MAG: IclR family transcriptional regulator [Brachybacterium sp.]|nr:IclR family transcriptional regulator [Brachybacterium sp.]
MAGSPDRPSGQRSGDSAAAGSRNGHQAVDRALEILWILRRHPRASGAQIAEMLGVHKSTVSRLLAALAEQHLVDRSQDGTYALGFGLLRLAEGVTHRLDRSQVAQALVDRAAGATGLTANVAILDGPHAVNISQAVGGTGVLAPRHYVGLRTPGHATSSGKLLLAHAPADVLEDAVTAELHAHTGRTITDPGALRRELTAVARRGWAVSDREWEDGVTAVAVPLRDVDGRIDAALTVTGPVHELPPESFEATVRQLTALAAAPGAWF